MNYLCMKDFILPSTSASGKKVSFKVLLNVKYSIQILQVYCEISPAGISSRDLLAMMPI